MKSILATAIVLCSLTAFAGPEEHISSQVCYSLKKPPVTANIPARVCVENITIYNADFTDATLEMYSYFNPDLLDNMKLTYIARRNEDGFSYRAENVLFQSLESGCGSAEKVTLKVSGRADNYGTSQIDHVDFSVKHETQADTCHSKVQTHVYRYVKE